MIASSQDLGSVPSLFGRPQTYAQFLGVELRSFYRERLVVVMPAGFGVYRGGRSVTAEQRTIAGVKPGASADELASAAATAVGKLRQALGHRRSGDSRPPHVQALSSSGKRGGVAPLRYKVSDNSGRARTELRVYGPNYNLYATLQRPFLRVRSKVVQSYKWKVPPGLPGGAVRFCVLAADHGGNLSTTSCAALRLG